MYEKEMNYLRAKVDFLEAQLDQAKSIMTEEDLTELSMEPLQKTFTPSSTDNAFSEAVVHVLNELHIRSGLLGYDYLKEAIKMSYQSKKRLAITSELYPSIAKTHDTTPTRVERAIRHSIFSAWNVGDLKSDRKPTNRDFIGMATERVKLALGENLH